MAAGLSAALLAVAWVDGGTVCMARIDRPDVKRCRDLALGGD